MHKISAYLLKKTKKLNILTNENDSFLDLDKERKIFSFEYSRLTTTLQLGKLIMIPLN